MLLLRDESWFGHVFFLSIILVYLSCFKLNNELVMSPSFSECLLLYNRNLGLALQDMLARKTSRIKKILHV